MVKRICPACGVSNYSSCTVGAWECHSCGGNVDGPNESAEDYVDNKKG